MNTPRTRSLTLIFPLLLLSLMSSGCSRRHLNWLYNLLPWAEKRDYSGGPSFHWVARSNALTTEVESNEFGPFQAGAPTPPFKLTHMSNQIHQLVTQARIICDLTPPSGPVQKDACKFKELKDNGMYELAFTPDQAGDWEMTLTFGSRAEEMSKIGWHFKVVESGGLAAPSPSPTPEAGVLASPEPTPTTEPVKKTGRAARKRSG